MAAIPYAFGYNNQTAVERQPVNVWTSIEQLPAGGNPVLGAVPTVANAIAVFLPTSNPRRFMPATPADFSAMIPANYYAAPLVIGDEPNCAPADRRRRRRYRI